MVPWQVPYEANQQLLVFNVGSPEAPIGDGHIAWPWWSHWPQRWVLWRCRPERWGDPKKSGWSRGTFSNWFQHWKCSLDLWTYLSGVDATQLDATLWYWYFYSNAGKYDIQKSKWAILLSLDGDLQIDGQHCAPAWMPQKTHGNPQQFSKHLYDVTSWLAGFQPSTYCNSKGLIILVLGRLPFLTGFSNKKILDVRWSTVKMKKFVPRVLNKLSNLLFAGFCNPVKTLSFLGVNHSAFWGRNYCW